MFKNHPKGMMWLFFTEMWERFGFYTLMAILVLYMDNILGFDDSYKGDVYGIFLGFVYFIPLLGGWMADKLFGQLPTVITGAIFMLFGFVALALSSLENLVFFYSGLACVAFGTGIFKVNIATLVGNLYAKKPELKDAGFNIYYMGVNVGATIAPLVATVVSFTAAFWTAAFGMVLAIIIFMVGKKDLVVTDYKNIRSNNNLSEADEMPKGEFIQRIVTLLILFVIVIFFWIGFYQNGFALTLFAERSTIELDWLKPQTYQFFNPFFILLLTPFLLKYLGKLNKKGKEPSTPVKIFIGMLIMGIAMVIMVPASLMGGNLDQPMMSPGWLISTYLFVTLAEILISPMGLSYVSKVAPVKVQGLMMGGWFVATALGSYGSGLIGKYYSDFAHHEYFMILTGILAFSAILAFVFMGKLKRFAG